MAYPAHAFNFVTLLSRYSQPMSTRLGLAHAAKYTCEGQYGVEGQLPALRQDTWQGTAYNPRQVIAHAAGHTCSHTPHCCTLRAGWTGYPRCNRSGWTGCCSAACLRRWPRLRWARAAGPGRSWAPASCRSTRVGALRCTVAAAPPISPVPLCNSCVGVPRTLAGCGCKCIASQPPLVLNILHNR